MKQDAYGGILAEQKSHDHHVSQWRVSIFGQHHAVQRRHSTSQRRIFLRFPFRDAHNTSNSAYLLRTESPCTIDPRACKGRRCHWDAIFSRPASTLETSFHRCRVLRRSSSTHTEKPGTILLIHVFKSYTVAYPMPAHCKALGSRRASSLLRLHINSRRYAASRIICNW